MISVVAGLRVAHTVVAIRQQIAAWRAEGLTIALVPTMGALHEGHLGLLDLAAQHADRVVVSIFVNPTQFAPGEDLERYPRTLERDCELSAERGAHLAFAPAAAEMYAAEDQTRVSVARLGSGLCAMSRPHFFGGVATVVCKLLNIVGADVAIFGEKDYQQLQVIRRMVIDLHHPTRIVGAPIAREADGLAMSSRNAYLSADERQRAAAIHRGLLAARAAVTTGVCAREAIVTIVAAEIKAAGGRLDYVELVDPHTLTSLDTVESVGRLAVAAFFGATRLIDNMVVGA